jgi:hypothetical protein
MRIEERRTMAVNSGSAKIYRFPARGRFAGGPPGEQQPMRDGPTAPSRVTRLACGSGWYHDDAIREAERLREQEH